MEDQPTLPGLEPSRKERTATILNRALRELGIGDSLSEAWKLLDQLEAAELLVADPPLETAVEISLVQTCAAAPEQYDVFRDGRQMGYLRLRHGYFRAHYPDHRTAEAVYETGVRGDGVFHDDEERSRELRTAAVALLQADGVEHPDPIFEIPEYSDEEYWDESSMAFYADLARAASARRAEDLKRFHGALQSTVDEAMLAGASSAQIIESLKGGGFIADRAPYGYGEEDPTDYESPQVTVASEWRLEK